jgi:peptidyl-prolyl cis-trans isomerase-like 2
VSFFFEFTFLGLNKIPENNFVCTKDGFIFDILNIIPYVQKYKVHPVSGAPLEVKDLIKLHLSKNKEGNYECPITHNELTEYTKIAAVKTSGNVYTFEALEEMNFKLDQWTDFLTGEEFTKEDVIILQDPHDTNRHSQNLTSFHHVKEDKKRKEIESQSSTYGINVTSETERLFKEIDKIDQKNKEKMKEKGGEESTFLYKSTPREAGMKSSSLTSSSMEISKFCLFNPRNKG